MEEALDPNNKDSNIIRSIIQSIDGLRQEIYDKKREGETKSVKKGEIFEKEVFDYLSEICSPYKDEITDTSKIKGNRGDTGDIVKGAIDPSRGAILGLLIQTPGLSERVSQGGVVGYIIIGLLIIGLLLSAERIFRLTIVSRSVNAQSKDVDNPNDDNPLGRVLSAYHSNQSADVETLELKLDDAILKELPALERGINFIKLLSSVAPLLGLLGTVTGMIVTFQAITLFGTGDPKLMAGGISQALVTTVLGLTAAIPLVLLHSVAQQRSRSIQQVLEEQSAGLIAAKAESR